MTVIRVEPLFLDQLENRSHHWDRFVSPGHFALSRGFLSAACHLEMNQLKVVPLLLYSQHDEPFGFAISFEAELDIADVCVDSARKVICWIRRFTPSFMKFKMIEIGHPAAYGLPFRVSGTFAPALSALTDWVNQQLDSSRVSLAVIRDFGEDSLAEASINLGSNGFFKVNQPAIYAVATHPAGFAEFMKLMNRKYRYRARKCFESTSELKVEIINDYKSLVPEIYQMWTELNKRKSRYQRARITEEFYYACNELEESKIIILKRNDDSIAAFGLLFLDDSVLRLSTVGFTASAAKDEGAYYRLLYEVVRYAHDCSFETVALGITAGGPKMAVGAQPLPTFAFAKHRNPVISYILSKAVAKMLKPETEITREVFQIPPTKPIEPSLLITNKNK